MRKSGEIVTWIFQRHYGFVRLNDEPDGEQVFIHIGQLDFEPFAGMVGTRVSLLVKDSPKGPRGHNVKRDMDEPHAAA